jgi:hypothetical protein
MMRFIPVVCVLVVLSAAPAASQEFDTDAALAELEADNARLRGMEQAVIEDAMRDPQVQWQYGQYLAGGGTMSFPDYATWHARTNGGTTPFRPQSPGAAPGMGQWVYDGRAAAVQGGTVSGPDVNGQCYVVGGPSSGARAECPR